MAVIIIENEIPEEAEESGLLTSYELKSQIENLIDFLAYAGKIDPESKLYSHSQKLADQLLTSGIAAQIDTEL